MKLRRLILPAILVLLLLVELNFQTLEDQYYLHTFTPSASMSQLIGQLDLTQQATAMMYRGRPQIDSKTAFNTDCNPQGDELELGCYSGGRIYILQISNADLASEMEVVSAHELLHEAYDRLSSGERSQVDGWVEQAAASITDPDLKARLDSYARTEPGQRDNELHSILATEYGNLPAPLENYYTRYFQNRAAIVQAHSQYQEVFNSRKSQIDAELTTINRLKAQLDALDGRMQYLRDAGQISAYNALVPQQNQLVADVNGRIAQYNQDVTEYNDLSQSLNSQPIQTLSAQ